MRGLKVLGSRQGLHGLVALAAVVALSLLAVGCGSSSAAVDTGASTTAQQSPAAAAEQTTGATTPKAAGSALFDGSVVHEIVVSFAQEDYEAMIDTFSSGGDKEWIKAIVAIDGRTYENVGMRLKGNSSIMGLQRNAAGQGGHAGPMGGGVGGSASADTPEALPWLIDLDRNVDGQNHGGVVEFVVRSNTTETALNEAVALELLQEAGLVSQEAVAARFSVNGGEPRLRLVIENPDDRWMAENFDIGGALYKAESGGDYGYRGDDPDAYDEVFDQEAGKRNADLTPLIEFLDFINTSADETFNIELANHLDIDAFATYLAMQDLVANTDDIDGPGNNSYLYYDPEAAVFTVVAWDHNLAFGGMGGMGLEGGGGAVRPNADGFKGQMPGDMPVPDHTPVPGGGETPGDTAAQPAVPGQGRDRGGMPGGGGVFGTSNVLVERFKANPDFARLYEERLVELREQLYGGGVAEEILENWVTLLETQASDLVDAPTVTEEAARISRYFAR